MLIEIDTFTDNPYPKVAVQWLNQAVRSSQSLCLVDNHVLIKCHHQEIQNVRVYSP